MKFQKTIIKYILPKITNPLTSLGGEVFIFTYQNLSAGPMYMENPKDFNKILFIYIKLIISVLNLKIIHLPNTIKLSSTHK